MGNSHANVQINSSMIKCKIMSNLSCKREIKMLRVLTEEKSDTQIITNLNLNLLDYQNSGIEKERRISAEEILLKITKKLLL